MICLIVSMSTGKLDLYLEIVSEPVMSVIIRNCSGRLCTGVGGTSLTKNWLLCVNSLEIV